MHAFNLTPATGAAMQVPKAKQLARKRKGEETGRMPLLDRGAGGCPVCLDVFRNAQMKSHTVQDDPFHEDNPDAGGTDSPYVLVIARDGRVLCLLGSRSTPHAPGLETEDSEEVAEEQRWH